MAKACPSPPSVSSLAGSPSRLCSAQGPPPPTPAPTCASLAVGVLLVLPPGAAGLPPSHYYWYGLQEHQGPARGQHLGGKPARSACSPWKLVLSLLMAFCGSRRPDHGRFVRSKLHGTRSPCVQQTEGQNPQTRPGTEQDARNQDGADTPVGGWWASGRGSRSMFKVLCESWLLLGLSPAMAPVLPPALTLLLLTDSPGGFSTVSCGHQPSCL